MGATEPESSVERVLVAGASGKTGRRVLGRLADTRITVRALTRSKEKADHLRRLGADEVAIGDLFRPSDVERAVGGTDANDAVAETEADDAGEGTEAHGAGEGTEAVDAVLTCVGSTPLEVYRADDHVDGTGNENLVAAAVAADVEAFVMVSSLGVGDDRASWQARFFRTVVGPVVEAKTRAERAIRESGLRYTIFRPGLLLSYGPAGGQVAEADTGLWGAVTRGEVARLVVAAPFTPAAADRTFEVAANPLRRDDLGIDWRAP